MRRYKSGNIIIVLDSCVSENKRILEIRIHLVLGYPSDYVEEDVDIKRLLEFQDTIEFYLAFLKGQDRKIYTHKIDSYVSIYGKQMFRCVIKAEYRPGDLD